MVHHEDNINFNEIKLKFELRTMSLATSHISRHKNSIFVFDSNNGRASNIWVPKPIQKELNK